jgi:hypothetical protein
VLRHVLPIALALCSGVFVVLILNVINRGGRFALLSGLFGAMFSYIWPLLSGLFGAMFSYIWPLLRKLFERLRFHADAGGDVETQAQEPSRVKIAVATYGGIVYFGLLVAAAGSGLIVLPGEGLLFALLSGILGYVLFVGLLGFGLVILALNILRREHIN